VDGKLIREADLSTEIEKGPDANPGLLFCMAWR
jgi:hypothetical protein